MKSGVEWPMRKTNVLPSFHASTISIRSISYASSFVSGFSPVFSLQIGGDMSDRRWCERKTYVGGVSWFCGEREPICMIISCKSTILTKQEALARLRPQSCEKWASRHPKVFSRNAGEAHRQLANIGSLLRARFQHILHPLLTETSSSNRHRSRWACRVSEPFVCSSSVEYSVSSSCLRCS